MFKQVADKWFAKRTGQATLGSVPNMQIFARSGRVSTRKPKDKNLEGLKPFIVGESLVGGREVAL